MKIQLFILASALVILFSACANNPLDPSFDDDDYIQPISFTKNLSGPEIELTLSERVSTLESQVSTLDARVDNLSSNTTPSNPYTPPTTPIDPVDINNASLAELQALNGIGPVKAQAILNYITLNGPITDAGDLINVKGIGPKTLAKIENNVDISPPDQELIATSDIE